jgi:HPt (histidine-containing phosphotransfer) domain-containing protein
MIDWKRVKDLRAELGAEHFADVVGLFLEEMETELPKLPQAQTAPEMVNLLHFLKGGALNLGFAEFSELCRNGEAKASGHGPQDVNIGQIVASYHRSRACFVDGLEKIDAG